jgi:hypothetical protein
MSAMKTNIARTLFWTVALTLLVNFCPAPLYAQVTNAFADKIVKRAVFVVPTNAREGCDPFYPDSTRPYEAFAPPTKKSFEMSSLVLHGISGMATHRFAVINNHTFAEGDEGDVLAPTGRIHLRCIEIKASSAVIEVNGQRHELIFSEK